MRKSRSISLLSSLAIGLCAASGAQAVPTGSQGFADIGTPTANGSAAGNINTATAFTIGDLVSTTANTGVFSGMSTQTFGSVSFSITNPTSLDFGNSVFGHFASTSIVEMANVAGGVTIYALGEFTPGTFGGVTGGPFASDVTIGFTQTPAHSGSISDSATFSTPAPAGVPEPATLGLLVLGAAVGFARRQRRR